MGRLLSTGLSFVALVLVLALPARAEEESKDPKTQLKELAKAAKDNKDGEDMSALREALDGLAALYESCEDEDIREDIVDVVGKVSTSRREDSVTIEALYTLGQLRSCEGAKYVKRHLRQRDPKDADDVLRSAIDVAAQIPDETLVGPLLKLVEKSEHYAIAAAAMKALAKYGHVEKKRDQILETLVKTVKKEKPGQLPRNRGNNNESIDGSSGGTMTSPLSAGQNSRWMALSPVLPGVLNELTGQDVRGAGEWFDLCQDHKRDVGSLFLDGGE